MRLATRLGTVLAAATLVVGGLPATSASCARDGASAPNWDCTSWSSWISISTGEYT
ncbi:hypothetical protein [Micromonospora sp. CPCC 206061]|uniref:hypothetical protein n=1 Tax=Micromonospora sp. CPCC 206061 TaxID=3122410 RepID=UPI002FF1C69A